MKSRVNVDINADISDSTNVVVKNVLSKPSKGIGNAAGTIIDFFNNTILMPMRIYNMYAQDKLEKFGEELKNRTLEIPEEKIVDPDVKILGPAMEGLKYNLDEEYIKEMFLNILISDISKDKKEKVLPAYIEIVKQLSHNDAIFLKSINELCKTNKTNGLPVLQIKLVDSNDNFVELDKYIVIYQNKCVRTIKISQIVLDNLIRLGLVNYVEGRFVAKTDIYKKCFDILKNEYENIPKNNYTIDYTRNIFLVTEFGMNFLNVCIG